MAVESVNKEFLLRITNAIELLGGNDEIVSILTNEDMGVEEKTYHLKRWNAKQINKVKDRIVKLSSLLQNQPSINVETGGTI